MKHHFEKYFPEKFFLRPSVLCRVKNSLSKNQLPATPFFCFFVSIIHCSCQKKNPYCF